MAEQNLDRADAEHGRDRCDENISRHGEELPRLADASQVDDGDEKDCSYAEGFAMGKEARDGGGERGHSGRDADGDGQDVVDH